MKRLSQTYRRRHQRCAWALAALLLFAQAVSAAHMVLVRHATCPIDGELIHVDDHRGQRAFAGRAGDRSDVEPGEAPEADHDHGHCTVASGRQDRVALRTPSELARTPPPVLLAARVVDIGPTPARLCLHRLAPKQSPPA